MLSGVAGTTRRPVRDQPKRTAIHRPSRGRHDNVPSGCHVRAQIHHIARVDGRRGWRCRESRLRVVGQHSVTGLFLRQIHARAEFETSFGDG